MQKTASFNDAVVYFVLYLVLPLSEIQGEAGHINNLFGTSCTLLLK